MLYKVPIRFDDLHCLLCHINCLFDFTYLRYF